MRKYILSMLILALPITMILVGHFSFVKAQSASDENIRLSCSRAQGYIRNELKSRDLKTRVDRLRAYQYIQRRIDIFVGRLERHKQPRATQMRLVVSQIDLAIASFKVNYEAYDAAREETMNLRDCKANIDQFKSSLERTRTELRKVVQSSKSIETLIYERFTRELNILDQQLDEDGKAS